MGDIRINLLPWRDQRREKKQREFLNILIAVVLCAVLVVVGADLCYGDAILRQEARNHFLQTRIGLMEQRIAQVRLLRREGDDMLARMRIVRKLRNSRAVIVRVFDELAKQLSSDIFYTSLEMSGEELRILGVAESSDPISRLLRNLSESEWFENPEVTTITADPAGGPRASSFELVVYPALQQGEENQGERDEGEKK